MSFNQFLTPNNTSVLLANRLSLVIQPLSSSLVSNQNLVISKALSDTSTDRLKSLIKFGSGEARLQRGLIVQPQTRTSPLDRNLLKQRQVNPNLRRGTRQNNKWQTREEVAYETIKLVNQFFANLNEPQLSKKIIDLIVQDDVPDGAIYNEVWQSVLDDLVTIFSELESIEDTTVDNFNSISTVANRLTSRLKSVASKLGDYILFTKNPNNDSFYYKDSFNDVSKIHVGSSLLNKEECTVSKTEGIATLPHDETESSLVQVTSLPVINPNSNGVIGNNQELHKAYNGDISKILDNNPDTTFEYENIVDLIDDNVKPLVLDMVINLGTEQVVNHIQINPNNFGTKTVIKIDTIETSFDGQVYTSIKDDIPIGDFLEEDEDNVFTLSPSTSKFAGQGLYTFVPRKIKYVHIVLKQQEPYVIETPNGKKLRYAIGLRDINIKRFKYKNTGELVSLPFTSTEEIRKVLLETNQNPTTVSELASLQYFISPDDGSTWHEILPKNFPVTSAVESIPEILNFNSVATGSIITPSPVTSVRVKIVMSRNDEKFTDTTSSLGKVIRTTSEMHEVPQSSPFDIDLIWPPVDGTIAIIDPLFGSRGLEGSPYIVNNAIDKINARKFRLPFSNLPRPIKKVLDGNGQYYVDVVSAIDYMNVEVGGDVWTQTSVPLSTLTLDFNDLPSGKVYSFDPQQAVIEFGDGVSNSLKPSSNDTVAIWFEAERLFPTEDENNHVAQLEFNTSRNKNDFFIKRRDPFITTTEILPRRATRINLENKDLTDYSKTITVMNSLPDTTTEVTFINGKDELINSTDWSIDTETGIIYIGSPTPSNEDFTIEYTYEPITYITSDDWDWATTNIFGDSISIKESGWLSVDVTEGVLFAGDQQILHLSRLATVKDSYEINLTIAGTEAPKDDSTIGSLNPFIKEVDFVDGFTELGLTSKGSPDRFERVEEKIPPFTTDGNGIGSWVLQRPISGLGASFPLTHRTAIRIAQGSLGTEVEFQNGLAEFNTITQYSVNRITGSPNYGTVYYNAGPSNTNLSLLEQFVYYSPKPVTVPLVGLYSIDYKRSIIYTQRAMDPAGNANPGTWELEIKYQFTNYEAEYRIARFLDPTSYEVDITNKRIRLNDNEILKHLEVPHGRLDARLPYYLINYDYVQEAQEGAEELVDYFSPVVKDYALRILTKGKIF